MEIILLDDQSNSTNSISQPSADSYQARVVQTARELEDVERVTLFQPPSRPQSENGAKDRIGREPSLVAYGLIREATSSTADATQAERTRISDDVVGGVWVAANGFIDSDLHLRVDLADHQRWLFAARFLPEARGRGLYSKLLHAVLHAEVSSDPPEIREPVERIQKTDVWAAINPVNHRSVRAHARFQTTTAGRIHTIRVGSFAFAWKGTAANGHKLTLNPSWTLQGSVNPISMQIRKTERGS
jgi:hypothetical protein